ncbi:MAG: DNA replication/repair protein RecF [Dehalococcoidia bacterium]|nr:DNA replication/repair protein RecF [Dehalococcoidia bacterium]
MHITHLSLADFRNYRHLDLDLPEGPTVIQGDNAQGKTNLLESVHVLGTTRSHRASSERDLLRCDAESGVVRVARLAACARRVRGDVTVEVALTAEEVAPGGTEPAMLSVSKHLRVNGVKRRAADVAGQINVVMFTAQDIELAMGKSAVCRRYLDMIGCQTDKSYLRCLQRYQKVLVQRNHLLRLLQERQAQLDQLDFWDDELVKSGSYLILQRGRLVEALDAHAREIHRDISGGSEEVRVTYSASVWAQGGPSEIESAFREALHDNRKREILQGMTLAGPHRDTLGFFVNGMDVTRFGSRGQQQTVVLSLKLAEARHVLSEVKDHPIILLDDVFSELDLQRRKHLLALVMPYQQVLITATDLGCFDPAFLAQAMTLRVSGGLIGPV